MGLVRFNPAVANRFFDEFFPTAPQKTHFRTNRPAVNVQETDDDFTLAVAAPGFEKGDFEVKVDDGILTISVERQEDAETKHEGYTRREFHYGNFTRRFTLPEAANDADISATYTNGILTVVLPKKEEAKPQPARLIEIG
ncbi:MAG: Hsp20/alpha crystallin family protein [Bacteroidota bacterium]